MGWEWQVGFSRYDDGWRQARKLLDRGLRPGAAATYRHRQQERVHVLLTRLLETPNEFRAHVELYETLFRIVMYLFIPFFFQLRRRTHFGYDVRIRSPGAR